MKNISIIIIAILFSTSSLKAQTDVDALRYSGSSITGTARFTAMSGAFGALGGDFSSISYNPAGIAIYRSSEFTFTPSVYVSNTSSKFQGGIFDEGKSNFNFGNIGLVITKRFEQNQGRTAWQSWNFGIGYNRLANFHTRSYYQGLNRSNSMLDDFAENASGTDPDYLDPFYEGLAYNSYMINPDQNLNYYSVIPDGQEIQRRGSETWGAIGETVFAFGGNYANKFYVGAALAFKSLRYVESSTYEEIDPDTAIPYFNGFLFQQDFTTHGTGFDFKIGMIYKANEHIRLGLAVETPTWYSMHDLTKNGMVGVLDTGVTKSFESISPDGAFDYDLTTPFKAMGSLAIVFGKQGLISADYQYSDFGDAHFYAGGITFSNENNLINRKYVETHTVRIGTEWIYQNFSFRGGVSMVTSPISSAYAVPGSDYSKKGFSLGIGYRENNLFFDLGYAMTKSYEYFQPYSLSYESVPGVRADVTNNNFTATFGVKF